MLHTNIFRRALVLSVPAVIVGNKALAEQITITGAGASFPAPLYQRWAAEALPTTNVRVNYQSIGSSGGINQIRARTVTFGATDAPLADPGDLFQFPTVEGAVVPIYNLPGVTSLNLSMTTINKIYSGTIRRWNDPEIVQANPGINLRAIPITPIYRADGSGTTFIWTNAMKRAGGWNDAGTSIRWPVGQGARGNEGISNVVRRVVGAIGYVEYIYSRVNNIPFATMDSDVRGRTFILMPKNPVNEQQHQAAVKFFSYCLTQGLTTARNLHYHTFDAAEYEQILNNLRQM